MACFTGRYACGRLGVCGMIAYVEKTGQKLYGELILIKRDFYPHQVIKEKQIRLAMIFETWHKIQPFDGFSVIHIECGPPFEARFANDRCITARHGFTLTGDYDTDCIELAFGLAEPYFKKGVVKL